MNVLFISPNFPPQYYLFCAALKARGATVLGLGDSPVVELNPALAEVLTEYVHVGDMGHYGNVLRATAHLIARHGRIDRLDSLNEHWLGLEGKLREDFNVEGPKVKETTRNRSKTLMKGTFQAAGIPCARGEKVYSHEQAKRLAKALGFPLVFKPDVGVGAARTFKVSNDEELDRALAGPLEDTVVEEFVSGDIVTYDGLCDREGKVLFSISHAYNVGVMEAVTGEKDIHYYSLRDIPQPVADLGQRVVAAFGIRERFFHVELFVREEGGPMALEVNFRPPGGFTTDMMNYACDIDVYALWADVLTAGRRDFAFERKYHVAHAARRFSRRYRLSHEELVGELGGALLWTRLMPPVFAGVMGDVVYMLRHPDLESLKAAIARVEGIA